MFGFGGESENLQGNGGGGVVLDFRKVAESPEARKAAAKKFVSEKLTDIKSNLDGYNFREKRFDALVLKGRSWVNSKLFDAITDAYILTERARTDEFVLLELRTKYPRQISADARDSLSTMVINATFDKSGPQRSTYASLLTIAHDGVDDTGLPMSPEVFRNALSKGISKFVETYKKPALQQTHQPNSPASTASVAAPIHTQLVTEDATGGGSLPQGLGAGRQNADTEPKQVPPAELVRFSSTTFNNYNGPALFTGTIANGIASITGWAPETSKALKKTRGSRFINAQNATTNPMRESIRSFSKFVSDCGLDYVGANIDDGIAVFWSFDLDYKQLVIKACSIVQGEIEGGFCAKDLKILNKHLDAQVGEFMLINDGGEISKISVGDYSHSLYGQEYAAYPRPKDKFIMNLSTGIKLMTDGDAFENFLTYTRDVTSSKAQFLMSVDDGNMVFKIDLPGAHSAVVPVGKCSSNGEGLRIKYNTMTFSRLIKSLRNLGIGIVYVSIDHNHNFMKVDFGHQLEYGDAVRYYILMTGYGQ